MNNKIHNAALAAAFTLAAIVNLTTANTAFAILFTSTQEVVDFDEFVVNNTFFNFNSPAAEDNVAFETDNPSGNFLILTTDNAFTTGSNLIFPDNGVTETITFSAVDPDATLSLLSIDIAELINTDPVDITFTGLTADDVLVTETITTEGDQDFASVGGSPETYTFNALASGQFTEISVTNVEPGVGLDNITFNVNTIPEPSSLVLLGLSVLAAARIRCRIV